MTWRATAVTLFPEMFPGPLGYSLAGRGLQRGVWRLDTTDIRTFAADRHRSVDDTPAGGGPGMVLRADILAAAVDAAAENCPQGAKILLTPRGEPLTQRRVGELARGPGLMLICGRFEGVDQRLVAARRLEEISVGDVILSGGELAALMLLDACVRLLAGIMGDAQSAASESFEGDLLEYPQFTRPASFEGRSIPEALTAGDHGRAAAWRRAEALHITRVRRPDLWERYVCRLGQSRHGESEL